MMRRLSAGMEFVVAKSSHHHIQIDEPELIADQIKRMIDFSASEALAAPLH
jgi:hypothetical protein